MVHKLTDWSFLSIEYIQSVYVEHRRRGEENFKPASYGTITVGTYSIVIYSKIFQGVVTSMIWKIVAGLASHFI